MRIPCCIFLGFLFGAAHLASAGVLYSVTDLGTLGGPQTSAFGINNKGEVTGYSVTSAGQEHAFIYSNGEMTDLGTFGPLSPLSHYTGSTGYGINNGGQVAGYSVTPTSFVEHAFLYSNGQMMDLGTLGGAYSQGIAINDRGQVTGWSDTSTGGRDAFLYTHGQLIDLGPGAGYGINNRGQVTGSDGQNAFLYSGGQMINLGPGAGTAINNRGQVIGGTTSDEVFLYGNGQMIDLGIDGDALAINDKGQIVGYFFNTPFPAFLYSNGEAVNLNSLIDPALGIKLFQATGINDSGEIVANGRGPSGDHAFLLTPVPEPSTLALLSMALLVPVACIRHRRRKTSDSV